MYHIWLMVCENCCDYYRFLHLCFSFDALCLSICPVAGMYNLALQHWRTSPANMLLFSVTVYVKALL